MSTRKIAFMLEIGDQDWRAVRRLLKCLLRAYGLKCIAIQPARSESKVEDKP